MKNKLKLIFHTVKYLKFKQLFFLVYYKIKINKIFKQINSNKHQSHNLFFKKTLNTPISFNGHTFIFLNLPVFFDDNIDWNFSKHGKLWTYNLNYFDFLNQEDMTFDLGIQLINQYISGINDLRDGIEPYPISIRGINWIKFISKHRNILTAEQLTVIDFYLFQQYTILFKNLEYHLLGNHLLENGFSLLFAAYYFQNVKFYKKAKTILCSELREQILDDGAHFELSPMYHQIILHKVLDCINLIQNNCWHGGELIEIFMLNATKMLSWLNIMTFRDGSIPLLNDSARKIGPTTCQLNKYASELGVFYKKVQLSESGYRKFSNQHYECVVDIGRLGPDYQPGHAHADTFNFVLYIGGKSVVVDTGISTYEKNNQRHFERSTCSHNTVEINQLNSSQVWDGFRVAKRANVFDVIENTNSVKASHDGYKTLGAIHTRLFEFHKKTIKINDHVSFNENILSVAHIHFSPDQFISLNENIVYGDNVIINFSGYQRIVLDDYFCAGEFNKLIKAQKIIIYFKNNLETTFIINQ